MSVGKRLLEGAGLLYCLLWAIIVGEPAPTKFNAGLLYCLLWAIIVGEPAPTKFNAGLLYCLLWAIIVGEPAPCILKESGDQTVDRRL